MSDQSVTLASAALLLCLAAVATAAAPVDRSEKKRPPPRPPWRRPRPSAGKSTAVVVVRGRNGALRRVALVRVEPVRPSFGQLSGLHDEADALELKSSVALVLDQDTNEVLFSKNAQAVLPIASITKLMTALVVTEANLPLDEMLTITDEDVDTEKGSRSRLASARALARRHAASGADVVREPRRARARPHTIPGGLAAFVAAMNHKARELGMIDTRYVEPTGLSSRNQSSARDLATLVKAAHRASDHPRAVDVARVRRSTVGNRPAPVPQHQRAGAAARSGRSACRRPATSPKPAAAS